MDSLLAVGALEGLLRPSSAGGQLASLTGGAAGEFDVVVFDGPSSGEVLRMVGAPERSRWGGGGVVGYKNGPLYRDVRMWRGA